MANIIGVERLKKMFQRDLLAPSIYELSLMTNERRDKRLKEYKEKLKELK